MDDGVVILETKDVVGSEYRVAYCDDVEKIYGVFDDNTGDWTGDSGAILDYFAECTIYTDEEAAWAYAMELAAKSDYLENGVFVIRDFKNKEFNTL